MVGKIDNFDIFKNAPIDTRSVFSTIVARNALNAAYRYEGLITYCIEDTTLYMLLGGIDNANWTPIAGTFSVSTIDADRPISMIPDGTNLSSTLTLSEFLEATFFYTAPSIVSFTGGTTLEIGEDTLTRTLSYNVTEPTNSYVIASIVITGSDGYNSGDIKTGTGNQSGTHNVTLITNTNTTYTLTVTSTQAGVSVASTTSFTFSNKVFYGVSTIGTYNQSFITALTGSFDTNYSHSFTVTAGAGQYIYYAVPKDYVVNPYLNPPYFYVGGFSGGFEIAAATISYTYEGNTEDYILYKSVNPNLGLTSVTIQTTN